MEGLNKRKKLYDNLRILGVFLIIIGVLVSLIILDFTRSSILNGLIYVSFIPGLVIYLLARKQVKKISIEFKSTFVKQEIEKRIEDSQFNPYAGIPSDIVDKSNLVKLCTTYNSEDLLTGKIKDVDFECADVHIKQIRHNGKTTYYVTTFKGRFYKFDFPKQFNSNVFLLQHGQYRPFSGFEKIKLESIDFNSEFKIYTNNEHDTFYLLTPPLMEKLLVLDNKYCDKIGFSFLNNKLYIAIDSRKDAFDVMHLGAIDDSHINEAIQEIENIIEFVEYLRLDNTLFKKKE